VPTVFLQHTRVSSGGLACEQENPEVRGGVGLVQKSTTSSNSYSSPIDQARPQPLEETPEPSSSLFNPWMPKHHRHGKANCHHHRSS
jgi:hypothetical protein